MLGPCSTLRALLTMFKGKSNKVGKSRRNTSATDDTWQILSGKENLAHRADVDVDPPPPPGVLVREAPWAQSSGLVQEPSSPLGRPRTSSLSQINVLPDRATDVLEKHVMNRAFEHMLDELQIPSATRSKLATLDTPVKAAMLKSSHVLNIDGPLPPPPSIGEPGHLRKSRSSTSLAESPRPGHMRSKSLFNDIPYKPRPSSSLGTAPIPPLDDVLDRGSTPWMKEEFAGSSSSLGRSSSPTPLASASSSMSTGAHPRRSAKDKTAKEKERDKELAPGAFASMLNKTTCTTLDVEKLKKLRLMLRNESAG